MTPLSKLPNFDPHRVPVLGVDAHLPAIAPDQLQAAALQRRFANPPHWHPELVIEHKFADRLPAHASVLVPLIMHARPSVLLTERTAHLSTHSGQVAFPGGKADEGDEDAAATALREAHEEVGLDERFIEVIGTLPIYTTGTSFIVTPVVALVTPGFVLRPNPDEVADAFEVPLDFLMNPANHRRHAFEWEGVRREWFSMPYTDPAGGSPERFVWGATAGMLRNFYRFLAA
ncbi:MAG TPA: CoA pyrophosphatase [Burkholderiaceae bacterium]|nr:CoA pyrophosphatase [Burkholderiaceae bacterium]